MKPRPGRKRATGALAVALAALVAVGAAFGLGLPLGATGDETPREHGEGAARGAGGSGEPPNIVFVMTDDQRVDEMRVMEATRRHVVERGVAFERFYATLPLCCPSRASFLTGLYAHNHGVLTNDAETGGGMESFDDSETIAVALAEAGYRTGFVGKYLNGYAGLAREDPGVRAAGWDEWYATITPSRMFDWVLSENGTPRSYEGEDAYQTDVLAEKAVELIREGAAAPEPFFVTVWPLAPHGEPRRQGWPNPRPAPRHRDALAAEEPARPPSFNPDDLSDKPPQLQTRQLDDQDLSDLRERSRSRLQSLLAVDEMVDGIVAELRRTGELDNTYLIFASDQGYLLGEHRMKGKARMYEESVRAPLAISGPGLPRGASRDQVTANIDLAPTILELAGVAPLAEPDGISLLPLIDDPDAASDRHVLLHRDLELNSQRSQGVRGPRHVYLVHERPDGEVGHELYDLERDPHQTRNLIGPDDTSARDPADRARVERVLQGQNGLAARLEALRECRGHEGSKPCA